jgi:hypothetical protein
MNNEPIIHSQGNLLAYVDDILKLEKQKSGWRCHRIF